MAYDLENIKPQHSDRNWRDTIRRIAAEITAMESEAIQPVQSALTDAPSNGSEYVRKDGDWAVATGGGGSTKDYASFYATSGATSVAATATELTLDNTRVTSSGSVFVLASNFVTINKTGDFKISADVVFNNSSTSRTEYSIYLKVNDVEVIGTRSAIYDRGYDSGSTGHISTILSITSGDNVRIEVVRTDGGATAGYQEHTRLTIEEK